MFESLERFINKKKSPAHHPGEKDLTGTHIAILAADGFEQRELFEPKESLERAGAVVHIVSLRPGKIKGWHQGNWARSLDVDMTVREAWSVEFDALVLPGGVINPDKLRMNAEAVAFVMSFVNKHRPVAAICHGVQTLIETGTLKGRRITSWPSIKTDLINAGAHWVDKDVVVDHRIITSRRPDDLPVFNLTMIREFSEGKIHHLFHQEDPGTSL